MPPLRLTPVLVGIPLAVGIAAACGGATTEDDANAPVGSGGSAGLGEDAGTGGHPATPGGTGGSGAAAAGGSGATSGADAAGAEACSAAPEPGDCTAAIPTWYHDPATGLCLPFGYGGCGGNANNYSTRDRCLAACRGGDPNLDACEVPSDCMMIGVGCCGACEPLSANQLIALRVNGQATYEAVYGCGDVQCESCLGILIAERTGQFFYPTCVDGQCTARDVREQDFTRCASSADCYLRCGSGCCESCSDGADLIAVNADADLNAELCDDEPPVCPACVCTIPEGASAECVDDRCVVKRPPICTPGMDQTCNDSPIMSYIAGTCNDDGTCTCNEGYTMVSETGRCS